jgi:hypothetical protein
MSTVHAMSKDVHGDKVKKKYEETKFFSDPFHGIPSCLIINNCIIQTRIYIECRFNKSDQ